MTTPNIQELRRQRAQRHARSPFVLKLLIVLVGLYAVYVLAGFFVAPAYLKSQIERRASEALKRDVQVDHVAFNPLVLSMRIDRLHVKDRDGQFLVGWRQLFFNLEIFSLISDEIHFSEIELDGFASRLAVSKEGILNISDILDNAPKSSKTGGKTWAVRIDRLAVNRAELDYSDASRSEPFATHVGPTTFVLREFRTSGGPGAPGVFRATTEAGETLEWTGRLALAPLRSNGEFRVQQMALKKYAPFYASRVNFDILGGTLDLQIPYEFTIENNKPQVKVTQAGAQLQALQIAERGKTDPLVSLRVLDAAHASLDLQAGAAEVRQVTLTGGRVVVRRSADGINLANLLHSPSTPPASSTADAGISWRAQIGELSGKEFSVTIDDRTTPRPGTLELNRATFSVKKFASADLGAWVPVELNADISPGGGKIHVDGRVALKPAKAEVSFGLESASALALSPWVETFADVLVTQGLVAVRGQAHVSEDAAGALVLSASTEADLTGVNVTDGRGDDLVRWKSLSVRGVEYSSTPARITVADVSIADPEARLVRRKDNSLNVSTISRQKPAAKPQPTIQAGPTAPSQFIAVDRVALANASVRYVDQSIEPNVQTSIDQLSGTIAQLTSAAIDRADVDFNGRIGGTAPFSVKGKINVLADPIAADVHLEAHDSDLLPLAPYVAKFVGFQLASGAVSFDSKAKVNNRKLDSTTNVVVTNFNLGPASNSPDAPHVPVHLALALLRDKEGKIVLDLPVQGSLDDPSFDISGVVLKVITGLVTKAATSPFSLIGAMFGGGRGGEDLGFQEFAIGSSQIEPNNTQKLDVIAKALRERPALKLAITGRADPTAELAALRDQELERRVRSLVWADARKSDSTLDSPEKVVVSREAAAQALTVLYRDAFMQPPPEPVAPVTPVKPAEEPRRGFFLFRWFTRSKPQPPPPTAQVPAGPAAARPGGKVIAGEYGKVIGGEYATVIGDAPSAAALPNPDEMRRKLLEAVPVGDNEVRRLASQRAEHIRDYLITRGGVAPERVEVVATELPAKGGTRATFDLR